MPRFENRVLAHGSLSWLSDSAALPKLYNLAAFDASAYTSCLDVQRELQYQTHVAPNLDDKRANKTYSSDNKRQNISYFFHL